MRHRMHIFLEEEVAYDPFHHQATFAEFVARFQGTGNSTARQTVARMAASQSHYL